MAIKNIGFALFFYAVWLKIAPEMVSNLQPMTIIVKEFRRLDKIQMI